MQCAGLWNGGGGGLGAGHGDLAGAGGAFFESSFAARDDRSLVGGDRGIGSAAAGRTFGIVGLGRIGTAAAVRAKAFGFDVVFYDPYVPDGMDKALGIRRVFGLGELLEESHILSLHCPLTEETRGMIGANEIAAMPAGGIVVNTARGGVLDTAATVQALEIGHLKGAGIDVLETEPPGEGDAVMTAWRDPEHPAHDRLILNPHAAFFCDEGEAEFRRKGAMEVLRILKGEPLRNRVG